MKALANFSRVFTGLVFIFSGFVKGVDPLGTAYRLEDYFIAFNWHFFMPFALTFAILLCALEFTVGVMLLLNIRIKFTAWLLLLIMVFFTGLTFNDALNNPVPDCGCFGDAIKLTNWQTFYKNIVLIVLAIIVFAYRRKFKPAFNKPVQWVLACAAAALFIGFCYWNYNHLPAIDFTEYKVGHKLYAENPQPAKYYLTYQNKATKEKKEFLSPNYPYSDSVWMSQWEFVSQRVDDPNVYYGKSLIITDTTGTNFTNSVVRNPGYQMIVNVYDLSKTNIAAVKKINELVAQAAENDIAAVMLVSASPEEIKTFGATNKVEMPIYICDDIVLKTMVRSNPGIMLLKNGEVMAKWHYNDTPQLADLKKFIIK